MSGNSFSVHHSLHDWEVYGRSIIYLNRKDKIRLLGIVLWSLLHPHTQIKFNHEGTSEFGRWVEDVAVNDPVYSLSPRVSPEEEYQRTVTGVRRTRRGERRA